MLTTEDEEGILLALQHRDRVEAIYLQLPVPTLQKLIIAIDDEFPALQYTHIGPPTKHDSHLTLPLTFEAPHLRRMMTAYLASTIGSTLLSTAIGLVELTLDWIHPSAYPHPNDLLNVSADCQICCDNYYIPLYCLEAAYLLTYSYEARRPVPDDRTSARPEPWPGPGDVIEDLDVCTRTSVSLEGEQNIVLPCEGSEQYAAPCTPQIRPLKPPDLTIEDLGKAGGASAPNDVPGLPESPERLGLVSAAIGMQERGGALSATNAVPAPTEDTAGVELVGTAERAAAAEPEALEPWAGDKAGRGPHTAPRHGIARSRRAVEALLQNALTDGAHGLDTAPREVLTAGGRMHDTTAREHELDMPLPQGTPAERERERTLPTQEDPVTRRPARPPTESGCRHDAARRPDSTKGECALKALPQGPPLARKRERMSAPQDVLTRGVREPTSPPREDLEGGACGTDTAPHESPTNGKQGRDTLPREDTTAREHELETPLQEAPVERGHVALPCQEGAVGASECQPTRGDSTEHGPGWPSREGAGERTWPLREAPFEGVPRSEAEAMGTCQPKKPPWEAISESRRPVEAGRASEVGTDACPSTPSSRATTCRRRRHRFGAGRAAIELQRTRRERTRGLHRVRHAVTRAVTRVPSPARWPHHLKNHQ
jgi:hypothetical protein